MPARHETGEVLFFFTSHFFNRYNERLNLNLVHPKDIMTNFVSLNEKFQAEHLGEVNKDVQKIFVVNQLGIMLGHFDMKLKVMYLNTFITHDMLKGEQVEKFKQLSNHLDKYLTEKYV